MAAAPGTMRPPNGTDGAVFVESRMVPGDTVGGSVPGGYVENPLVSIGSPGMKLHEIVGSVPAMKNSVVSTPGHPGAHSVLVRRSTVFVTIPAGRGQSGGAGLRR